MGNKNEHPGTFKDTPEERILYITVNLEHKKSDEDALDHKVILDQAIQQTMLETGYETTTDLLSSHLDPDTPKYEAKILGHGSESYFHALGGACLKKVILETASGATRLNAGWRINASHMMQQPVAFE